MSLKDRKRTGLDRIIKQMLQMESLIRWLTLLMTCLEDSRATDFKLFVKKLEKLMQNTYMH